MQRLQYSFLFILNNTHNVLNLNSPLLNIYTKHKIIIIRIRTLQYSVEGCICLICLLSLYFLSSLFANATTKTVNFNEWFESFESFMSITSILLNEWVGVWIKLISNVMSLMSTLSTYSFQPVLINHQCWTEYEWIR